MIDLAKTNPNRAMLLTPPGSAAIAVVRLVGSGAGGFLETLCGKRLTPGRAVHTTLRDGDRIVDDPVIVQNEAKSSADVNLHGGPWVVAAFLELCRQAGFDIVESVEGVQPEGSVDGEDEIESLMLRHLPLAKTEEGLRSLLDQPRLWREFDWNSADRATLERIAADASLWWMLHPPRVAIVGSPNVGKSTLANQLFAQERSITADVPGTTRDWVGEIANLDGLAVMLVDTPGMRVTSDAVEAQAIERSQRVVQGADLIIRVMDASEPMSQADSCARGTGCQPVLDNLKSLHGLAARAAEEVLVLNKFDRACDWARSVDGAVMTVATTGEGVDTLRERIRARFDCLSFDVAHPRWWTIAQRDEIRERLKHA